MRFVTSTYTSYFKIFSEGGIVARFYKTKSTEVVVVCAVVVDVVVVGATVIVDCQ